MKQIYYKKALEIISKKNNLTISELFSFITYELHLSYKDSLRLINTLIESPIIEYNYETIRLKQK